jgi:hypothetical protein
MNATKKLLVVLASALLACGADDAATSGVRISATAVGSETCSFSPADQSFLFEGLLDVSTEYQTNPLAMQFIRVLTVRNSLTNPTTSSSATTADAKSWWPETARVTFDSPLVGGSLTRRFDVVSNEIPVDGEGVVGVMLVDRGLASLFANGVPVGAAPQQVVVRVKLEGVTGDGLGLDTNEWRYLISVCNGCLAAPPCDAGVLVFNACLPPGQDLPPTCLVTTAPPATP